MDDMSMMHNCCEFITPLCLKYFVYIYYTLPMHGTLNCVYCIDLADSFIVGYHVVLMIAFERIIIFVSII
jgi:hypothetical protein